MTYAAQEAETWQGSFQSKDLWGGMEMELTQGPGGEISVRARFTPQGHLEAPVAKETRISQNRISFVAHINGADYRFEGTRKRDAWEGTVQGAAATGTWNVTRLHPKEDGNGVLPTPSGPNAIGRVAFDWTDDSRPELETLDPQDHRRIMVYLFYPAQRSGQAETTAYIPDVDEMRGEWSEQQIVATRRVKTHSIAAAPCRRNGRPFPVVIFAPGGGQKALSYTAILEDLASHGFVVAAIDPPYNAASARFSDGTVLRKLPPAKRGWEVPATRDDMPRIYEQMVVHWARDMSFVLDRLADLNRSDSRFSGRFDLEKVGAMGHSRGGQAAGKVRLMDSRFDAGLNLDGNIRGRAFPPDSKAGAIDGGRTPFLWLEKQLPWPKKDLDGLTLEQFADMWANGDRLMQAIASESIRIQIARPEIDHLDFGDTAILSDSINEQALRGKERTLTLTRLIVDTFFDSHLKGGDIRRLDRLATTYPEIKLKRYTPTMK